LYTAKQKTGLYGTDNTDFGTRVRIINNDNVTTRQAAIDLAEFELNNLKIPPDFGGVTGSLLASIQPGEREISATVMAVYKMR